MTNPLKGRNLNLKFDNIVTAIPNIPRPRKARVSPILASFAVNLPTLQLFPKSLDIGSRNKILSNKPQKIILVPIPKPEYIRRRSQISYKVVNQTVNPKMSWKKYRIFVLYFRNRYYYSVYRRSKRMFDGKLENRKSNHQFCKIILSAKSWIWKGRKSNPKAALHIP